MDRQNYGALTPDLEGQQSHPKLLGGASETWSIPGYKCNRCDSRQQPTKCEFTGPSCGGIFCCMILVLTILCACCAILPWGMTKRARVTCPACGEVQEEANYEYRKVDGNSVTVKSKSNGQYSSKTETR